MDSKWIVALIAMALLIYGLSRTGLPAIGSLTQSTNNSFQIINR